VQLAVSDAEGQDHETWQYLSLTLGRFSDGGQDECADTWPREAIRLAREAIDRLEAELPPEVQNEANLESGSIDGAIA
jgi:hypothetical protein